MKLIAPPQGESRGSGRRASTRSVGAATVHCRRHRGSAGSSCSDRREVPYPHEVVYGQSEREDPVHAEKTSVPSLAHHPNRLKPPEDLLDALALPLAHLIARMPCGAPIECSEADFLGDV